MDYNGVSKYVYVKNKLKERIETEEFSEGSLFPSERELMEQYGVSRITVGKAVEQLVAEGYLYRIQGKGTYVKDESDGHVLFSLDSCTEDVKKLGKKPSRKVKVSNIIKASIKKKRKLCLMDEEDVYKLGRITYADGEPLNYTITYLPVKLFPGISEHDFEKDSLYHILENEYDTKIVRAKRSIEAVSAHDEICEYLELDEHIPVILFSCTTYGMVQGREVPIEYFECYYRTDHYKFYIDQVN